MNLTQYFQEIARVKEKLAHAESVTVLTGAGISAESGVPTFRGKDGIWRHHRATDLATSEAFVKNPKLVWEFYNWRRRVLSDLKPNSAHKALASMEYRFPNFTVITQNIDGLHQAAGSRRVLELHGNIWSVRCTDCGRIEENRIVPLPDSPTCLHCKGLLRPNVIWFGEALNQDILAASSQALRSCDAMLIIGTSGTVQPAASMGSYAKKQGAFVVEINLDPTPYSTAYDLSIHAKAGDVIPKLL